MSEPRSATVVIRAYGVLAAILDVAARDRRILPNPGRGVKMPPKGKSVGDQSQGLEDDWGAVTLRFGVPRG